MVNHLQDFLSWREQEWIVHSLEWVVHSRYMVMLRSVGLPLLGELRIKNAELRIMK
jgi:hypothetical protein